MADMTEVYDWRGRTVVDSDGDKIGKLDEIYLDQETGQPEWVLVNTGLLGSKSTFIPLAGAAPSGEDVKVAYDKATVSDAPGAEADGELSHEEESQLYRHYGMEYAATSGSGDVDTAPAADTSAPSTDDAMTRSEEELHVGKTQRESGRVRLKKYVVTEEVQQTVPVQREEVRLEREPITDANAGDATDGPPISEDQHEVVLHEEEVVTEKRAVPKERVRLDKDTVTDEQTVSEEVRKEQIEAEDDTAR
jgi:uncharacterized protein (TIGR02271 family)